MSILSQILSKEEEAERGRSRLIQHSKPGGRQFAVSSCLSLGVEKAREQRHYQEDLLEACLLREFYVF